ncbi:hypothetical protein QR98_0010600 [Sarcoptes scabiei]|uniref:Uncharacterized protein n=1 Tax=Sarcoptes scabiei TaxID=52283 RepID=A0A131ZV64_SARSC|nr:hypothetical protein QR98_0010600 [Sarcoptes scabiei]
MLKMKKEED